MRWIVTDESENESLVKDSPEDMRSWAKSVLREYFNVDCISLSNDIELSQNIDAMTSEMLKFVPDDKLADLINQTCHGYYHAAAVPDGKNVVEYTVWGVDFEHKDGSIDSTELDTVYSDEVYAECAELINLIMSLKDELDIAEVTEVWVRRTEMRMEDK